MLCVDQGCVTIYIYHHPEPYLFPPSPAVLTPIHTLEREFIIPFFPYGVTCLEQFVSNAPPL